MVFTKICHSALPPATWIQSITSLLFFIFTDLHLQLTNYASIFLAVSYFQYFKSKLSMHFHKIGNLCKSHRENCRCRTEHELLLNVLLYLSSAAQFWIELSRYAILLFYVCYWIRSRNYICNIIWRMPTEFTQGSSLKWASWILGKKQTGSTLLGLREIDCENWRWMELAERYSTL
jgi:hypothetical protein